MLKNFRLPNYVVPVVAGWMMSLNASAQAASTGDTAEKGRELYDRFGCYQCHGHFGQGGIAGPRLAPDPLPAKAFTVIVRRPPNQMPPYTAEVLSDGQLAEIYSYIESLETAPSADEIPLLRDGQ